MADDAALLTPDQLEEMLEKVDPAGLRNEPAPDYVVTEADRARWDISGKVALGLWEQYDDSDGPVNSEWFWMMRRSIYTSDVPTGSAAFDISEAAAAELEEADRAADRIAELKAEFAEEPGPGLPEDAYWDHIGRITDVFDELFGNPDDIDLGEYEGKVVPAGEGLEAIAESFAAVVRAPYSASLHPKDRLGKWTQKLNGVRSYAAAHKDKLRQEIGLRVAARRLHHDVRVAHKPGGGLHAPAHAAHVTKGGAVDPATRMRAHATEQRARQGIAGKKRAATLAGQHAHAHAIVAMATVYSEEFDRKLGPFADSKGDALATLEQVDRVHHLTHLAHEALHHVLEHHEETGHVIKHAARAYAASRGLAAADDSYVTDDDLAEADALLADL